MAVSFNRADESTISVLDLGITDGGVPKDGRWIAYPALAYRVYIPIAHRTFFNVFQRAVLGLCGAGVFDNKEIALRLDITSDLAHFIVAQLQEMQVLDRAKQLTVRGKELLNDDKTAPDSMESGFILKDPDTQQFYPYIVLGSLPRVEAELDDKHGRVEVVLGDKGNPKKRKATVIWPSVKEVSGGHPNPRQVLHILKRARAQVPSSERDGQVSVSSNIDLVTIASTDPEPVFFVTQLFVPENIVTGRLWQVRDPVYSHVSSEFRDAIERRVADGRGQVLQNVIENLTEAAYEVAPFEFENALALLDKQKNKRLHNNLRGCKQGTEDLLEALSEMESSYDQAMQRRSGDGAAVDGEHRRVFAGAAYRVLEQLFSDLQELYPAKDIQRLLSDKADRNERQIVKVLEDHLGIAGLIADSRFLRVYKNKVNAVVNYGSRDLPSQVVAAILVGVREPSHPVVRMMADIPNVLVELHELRQARNDASHNNANLSTWADDVERFHALTYRMVRYGLSASTGTGEFRVMSESAADLSMVWSVEHRLRAAKHAKVKKEFGAMILQFPGLGSALLSMRVAAKKASGEYTKNLDRNHVASLNRVAVVAAASTIEALLEILQAPAPGSEKFELKGQRSGTRIVRAARVVGLDLDEDGGLPESLTTSRTDRIQESLDRADRGTLGSRAAAVMLAAELDEAHPLRRIVIRDPGFMLEIGRIITIRGHGDKVDLKGRSVSSVVESVLEMTRVVKAVIS